MKHEKQRQRLDEIVSQDPRFRRDAYTFVSEAVAYTMAKCREEGELRHITGRELLDGIREYALDQFGPLALDVLQDWGVNSCEDFGDIVFRMVEHRLLGASDQDSPEDFKNGYEFREAFLKPFSDAGKPDPAVDTIA